jgi:endogenous inhibitor of DNA gyrase (YacG/DUF329 family)
MTVIEGKRPEQVLVKSDRQTVKCPNCGKTFDAPADRRDMDCPNCGQHVNWRLLG